MTIKKQIGGFLLLGLGLFSVTAVLAEDISETTTLINTPVSPKFANSFFSSEVIRLAAPVVSSAAQPSLSDPSSIPVSARKELGAFIRGGKTENALFTSSLMTMTALNIADYALTRRALKYPGLHEGNPLMRPFAKNAVLFAAVKVGTTVISYYGLKKLFKRDKTAAWILAMTSNLVLSYVVANNMRLIQRARSR